MAKSCYKDGRLRGLYQNAPKRENTAVYDEMGGYFLCLSMIVNGMFVFRYTNNKYRIYKSTHPYKYTDNAQYNAQLTVFELNDDENADIVFCGDSITLFGKWDEFFPGYEVLNRGIGSDTTEGLYHRLYEIEDRHPKKVFIMIGTNDGSRGIGKGQTIKNMESIIEELTVELPETDIYIEDILPGKTADLGEIEEINYGYEQIAKEQDNVHYISLFHSFLRKDGSFNESLFSADGVHLNGAGYRVWIDELNEIIKDESVNI